MRIAIGCDHAGFNLKQAVMSMLTEMGIPYEDFGCYDTTPVDYPDIGLSLAQSVANGKFSHGILICGTGIGMSVASNKVKGIRAALCHDTFSALRAREHIDANILCMGEWVVGQGLAREIVKTYLSSEFVGGRHDRRVKKIQAIEQPNVGA